MQISITQQEHVTIVAVTASLDISRKANTYIFTLCQRICLFFTEIFITDHF